MSVTFSHRRQAMAGSVSDISGRPLWLLAELTYRCPLQCPYCSNPLQLETVRNELSTDMWLRVLDEAADLGVLQIHLSGGEPASRRDLEPIVAKCAERGLSIPISSRRASVCHVSVWRNLQRPA